MVKKNYSIRKMNHYLSLKSLTCLLMFLSLSTCVPDTIDAYITTKAASSYRSRGVCTYLDGGQLKMMTVGYNNARVFDLDLSSS